MALPPSGKENIVHLLHHVWSTTDTSRRQQAGTGLMHRLQSHLSGSHCFLVTGKAGSISLWFQTRPKQGSVPVQTCRWGIRFLLPPLVRDWDKRTKKEGGGLKEEGKIYFFRLQVCSSHSCNERLEPLRNVKKSLSYNKSGRQDLKAPKTYSLINSSLWPMETIFSVWVRSDLVISHERFLYLFFCCWFEPGGTLFETNFLHICSLPTLLI